MNMSIVFSAVDNDSVSGGDWLFDSNDEDIVRFSSISYLTPVLLTKIKERFNSLVSFNKAKESDFTNLGFTPEQARAFKAVNYDNKTQMELVKKLNIYIVRLSDDMYPKVLKELPDPPLWLYVRGDILSDYNSTLTVVGTRKPSTYALSSMESLFTGALLKQITTVSGLAYGVDKKIHQLSLSSGGRTIAVLAGGLDNIYPSSHTLLAQEILNNGGALVSEYPPLSRPEAYRFPVRNRIIAGLSPLTIVIEAAIKSGTLTTARSAVDYNRDLMALPGDITRPQAEGTNYLIKSGAGLISSSQDLLDYYGIKRTKDIGTVDKIGTKLLDLLADGPKTADEIARNLEQDTATTLTQLTGLELSGHVMLAGGVYNLVSGK